MLLGARGCCRYCGTANPRAFRKIAHTFPEALGNRWVRSLDECDVCNDTFSRYEDALVACVGPFLTVGGVRGKHNHVRQTGRSAGQSVLRHHDDDGQRRVSSFVKGLTAQFLYEPLSGDVGLRVPLAEERFRPRLAYKALVKMGFALLPPEEIPNYQQLREWLLTPLDTVDLPMLDVGLSFANLGNSPLLVSGTLLRRHDPQDRVPHILFVFTAGSLCLQIDLRSDHLEDHIPCSAIGEVAVSWTTTIRTPDGAPATTLRYSPPLFFNWSGTDLVAQPMRALELMVHAATNDASFVPVFRDTEMVLQPLVFRAPQELVALHEVA